MDGSRSRVEGDKCTEGIELRSYFPDASVDQTEARNDILGCFGRSDRHALTLEEQGQQRDPGEDVSGR
jgi:hypothetical protein